MSALEGWLAPVGSRIAFLILATFSGVVFAPFRNLGLDRQRWTCSPLTVSWCPKASRQSLQQLGWFYLLFWSFCSCTRSIGWQLQSDQPSGQCLGSKLFQRLSSMTQQGRAPEVLQRLMATQGWNPCTAAPLSQDLHLNIARSQTCFPDAFGRIACRSTIGNSGNVDKISAQLEPQH